MVVEPTTTTPLEITIFRAEEWATAKPVWVELVDKSPYATFFTTAEWVEAWLEVFASRLKCEFVIFRAGVEAVGVCLLVLSKLSKHTYRFIQVNRIHLNTAGEPEGSPYIEFNNLLCLEGWEKSVAEALRAHINGRKWDELAIDGFCPGAPLEALRSAFADLGQNPDVRKNYFVDLSSLRSSSKSYESALGSKTRYRLRQNYKHYGDIQIEPATTVDQALAFLDQLADLHQKHWNRLGEAGSFASPLFAEFHRHLIAKAFGSGGIQFLRFSAAGAVIGLMYNFVFRGRVYFYQSGLTYNEDKRVRPGFVSIGKAVEFSMGEAGLTEFHLMPGGDHYKEPMGMSSHPVEWLLLRKPNLKFRIVEILRDLNRALTSKPRNGTAGPSDEADS